MKRNQRRYLLALLLALTLAFGAGGLYAVAENHWMHPAPVLTQHGELA